MLIRFAFNDPLARRRSGAADLNLDADDRLPGIGPGCAHLQPVRPWLSSASVTIRRTLTRCRLELVHGDNGSGTHGDHFAFHIEISELFLQNERIGAQCFRI